MIVFLALFTEDIRKYINIYIYIYCIYMHNTYICIKINRKSIFVRFCKEKKFKFEFVFEFYYVKRKKLCNCDFAHV